MLTVWRIVKAAYADQPFDGEGARLTGGRWNSPGTKMVYTADSHALATLELLVQLGNPTALPKFVSISATGDESLVIPMDFALLPTNWRSYPAPPELQLLGDNWIKSGSSLILRVPSVMAEQSNYLINPDHPDFSKLAISSAKPFEFDTRLFNRKPFT